MGIKILELTSGKSIICNIIQTIIPVTEDGKELEPLIYVKNVAELIMSFDFEEGVHRIHVAEWMCYSLTKPDFIRSSLLAFAPLDPDPDVESAYQEKFFDKTLRENDEHSDIERTFIPENYENNFDEENITQVLENIDKDPNKIVH